jgi:hypothetical protein
MSSSVCNVQAWLRACVMCAARARVCRTATGCAVGRADVAPRAALSVSKDHWSVEINGLPKRTAHSQTDSCKRVAAQRCLPEGREARRDGAQLGCGKNELTILCPNRAAVHITAYFVPETFALPVLSSPITGHTSGRACVRAWETPRGKNHRLFADKRCRGSGTAIALIAMGPPAAAGFQRGFG